MEQWSDPDPGSGIKHPGSATLDSRVHIITITGTGTYSKDDHHSEFLYHVPCFYFYLALVPEQFSEMQIPSF
jgi:hypothetical protein